jgi:hypothetical protein
MTMPKTVLYLDDETEWHDLVTQALANEFEVVAVTTIEDFRRELAKDPERFALFLVDLVDARTNSAEASKELLKELGQTHKSIPRVALTSGIADEGTDPDVAALGCLLVFKGEDLQARLLPVCRGAKGRTPKAKTQQVVAEQERKRKELQGEIEELQREIAFAEEWVRVCDRVVDEEVKFGQFREELLRFIMRHFAGQAAALFTTEDPDVALAVRTQLGDQVGSSVDVDCVSHKELGERSEIASALEEAAAAITIDDVRRVSAHPRSNFTGVHRPELCPGGQIIFAPLCEVVRSTSRLTAKGRDDNAGTNRRKTTSSVRAFGALVLYPAPRQPDVSTKRDADRLSELSLSTFLRSARDMPFRLYEDRSRMRKLAFPLVKLIRWSFLLAAAAVPLSFFWFLWNAQQLHVDPAVELLKGIALAVIFFTFLLFSVGLIVLYDPGASRVLPSWMVRFARPPEIERLVLTSAVSLTALLMVGMLAARLECYSDVSKAATLLGQSVRTITSDHSQRTSNAQMALTDAEKQLRAAISGLRLTSLPREPVPATTTGGTSTSSGGGPPARTMIVNAAQTNIALKSMEASVRRLDSASRSLTHNETATAAEVAKLSDARKSLSEEMAKVMEASSIGVLWTCLGGVALIAGIGAFQKFASSPDEEGE